MSGAAAAILFSGGFAHPFEETSPILNEMMAEAGWCSRIENDLDQALESLPGAGLLAVNALYWSMTQHEKYAPHRAQWAFRLGDRQMDRLEAFVLGGGRLFVLHTGTICWDTQPRWHALMGGGWQWGVSGHPPLGAFEVALTDTGAALSDGPAHFTVEDEAYHRLAPEPDCRILATADLGEGPQPLAWLRNAGKGKVAVDALGHDGASLREPGHNGLIRAQLRWLAE